MQCYECGGGRWHDNAMGVMSGTSVPLGTLQMTFRTGKAPGLRLAAAAHARDAQVVAPK